MIDEVALRRDMVRFSRSLFERGFTVGSSGNISVKLADGFLATPTNACLGFLREDQLSRLDRDGKHLSGERPTKELPLHLGFYDARPDGRAVVHLHSTYATLLSCLSDTDQASAIPPLTPYMVMRVGAVPVVPYFAPGSEHMRMCLSDIGQKHMAVLLANHGPVVCGTSLASAVYAAEELEETARLTILGRGLPLRQLAADDVAHLSAKA